MIEADGCDAAWMPNFAFRHFVRLKRTLKPARLDGVKLWVDCSEPCRWPDARGFEAAFADWGVRPRSVVGCYAMAETVFAVSQCAPGERRALAVPPAVPPGTPIARTGALLLTDDAPGDPPKDHKGVLSSGRVLPGLDVATYHEGQRLPEGVYGEIGIAGEFLFPAYRGRTPAESNITGGTFLTGDLGVILDGHVFVFGRLKEIIIVNGKNIFAGDVEAALGTIHGLKKGRAVVFGLDSDMTGSEELIVVAEQDGAAGVPAAELRSAVSRAVSEAFLVKPRDVRIVAERWLVKSTSGKISRDENRKRYLEHFRAGSP
jgi:acyl-CoA synthetase (AMP-forming)/AMP-acid ligase II